MTRDEVLQESQRANSGRWTPSADELGIFIFKWCVYKDKPVAKVSILINAAKATGNIVPLYLDALEMAEKEFSINKLYSASNPMMPQNQVRRLLLIF